MLVDSIKSVIEKSTKSSPNSAPKDKRIMESIQRALTTSLKPHLAEVTKIAKDSMDFMTKPIKGQKKDNHQVKNQILEVQKKIERSFETGIKKVLKDLPTLIKLDESKILELQSLNKQLLEKSEVNGTLFTKELQSIKDSLSHNTGGNNKDDKAVNAVDKLGETMIDIKEKLDIYQKMCDLDRKMTSQPDVVSTIQQMFEKHSKDELKQSVQKLATRRDLKGLFKLEKEKQKRKLAEFQLENTVKDRSSHKNIDIQDHVQPHNPTGPAGAWGRAQLQSFPSPFPAFTTQRPLGSSFDADQQTHPQASQSEDWGKDWRTSQPQGRMESQSCFSASRASASGSNESSKSDTSTASSHYRNFQHGQSSMYGQSQHSSPHHEGYGYDRDRQPAHNYDRHQFQHQPYLTPHVGYDRERQHNFSLPAHSYYKYADHRGHDQPEFSRPQKESMESYSSQTHKRKETRDWNPNEVVQWLTTLNYPESVRLAFARNSIAGCQLASLDDDYLATTLCVQKHQMTPLKTAIQNAVYGLNTGPT